MCLVFTYVCFLPTSVRVRAECDWCSLCGSYGALCSFIHCYWKADWQTGKIYLSVGTLLKITPPTFLSSFLCSIFVFYTMPSLIPRLGGRGAQRAWERGYTIPWNGICPQPFHTANNTWLTVVITSNSRMYQQRKQSTWYGQFHCMGQTAARQLVWL